MPVNLTIEPSLFGKPKPKWRDPMPEDLKTPEFEAIWQLIKTWDIGVPEAYGGYCGATGNHVVAILDALKEAGIKCQ